MSTFREILSRRNPDITSAWDGKSYGNTESSKKIYDEVIFDETYNSTIQEWTDFTYDAIDLAYGDILDQVPANYKSVNTPTTTPTTITDEKGVDKLGEAWTCNIVRAPIKAAGAKVRSRPTVADAKRTDPSLSSFAIKWKHPLHSKTQLDPDWAVFDRTVSKTYREAATDDTPKSLVFAIGDSKMYQKWQSAWVDKSLAGGHIDVNPVVPISKNAISKTHDVTSERLKPLAQLATYCRFAETRYGFILTQKELVVFRIRRIDPKNLGMSIKDPGKLHAAFEYKAVDWDASGANKLTVNFAIWALGCLGMNNRHREMEGAKNSPLTSMVRLTKWTHDKTKKLYRNDISGREIKEAHWQELGAKISLVQLDDAPGGTSPTSSFTEASGVSQITQQIGKVNLDTVYNMESGNGGKQSKAAANQPVKKPTPSPITASASTGAPRAVSPAKKYIIDGTKGPAFELVVRNGKTYFKKDAETVIEVRIDPKTKQYSYSIANPKDAKKLQVFHLKQV